MFSGRELSAALETFTELVNSGPPVWHHEGLMNPAQLEAFLQRHRLGAGREVKPEHVTAAHELRRRLGEVFWVPEDAAVQRLNAMVEAMEIRLFLARNSRGWTWQVRAAANSSAVSLLGAVCVVGLLSLAAEDGLRRLHRCAADGCGRVFVDTTRNRSRRYCMPRLCGNRTNLAAYRARQRERGQKEG